LSAAEAFGLNSAVVIGADGRQPDRASARHPLCPGHGCCWPEALLLRADRTCVGFGLSNVAVAAIVLAMGLENACSRIRGGGLGLTYVTGGVVKVRPTGARGADRGARGAAFPTLLTMGGDGDRFPVRWAAYTDHLASASGSRREQQWPLSAILAADNPTQK